MAYGPWIQTYTGTRFHVLDPQLDEINIFDIAHSLSRICRFNGHSEAHYSVAQHAVHVSMLCDEEDALWGLMHDAAEAYLSDIAKPTKQLEFMVTYREMEDKLTRMIGERFGLDPLPEGKSMPSSVKRADGDALMTEKRDLMAPCDWGESYGTADDEEIEPMSAEAARELFLIRFIELTGAMGVNEAHHIALTWTERGVEFARTARAFGTVSGGVQALDEPELEQE